MTKLYQHWEIAASDLGIAIEKPFILNIRKDVELYAEFLVKSFGAKNGMIVLTNYDLIEPYVEEVVNLGYGFSVLEEPADDAEYNRTDYIPLLSDWGWSGAINMKPQWLVEYTENDNE